MRSAHGWRTLPVVTDYLCSMYVTNTRAERLHVWATPDRLVLDPAPRNRYESAPARETFPLESVRAVEVESISDASSHVRWNVTTGFLGRRKQVPPVTGILVTLDDGARILLRSDLSPVEVRAALGRLLDRVAR
jgi:hypothetical protein